MKYLIIQLESPGIPDYELAPGLVTMSLDSNDEGSYHLNVECLGKDHTAFVKNWYFMHDDCNEDVESLIVETSTNSDSPVLN